MTLQLAIGAAILWLAIGIPIGILSALKRRTFADRAAMGFALVGVSAPVFWLGLVSLYIFWQQLGWLPGTGYVPFTESPTDWFLHMILPWSVLALLFAAIYARVVRGNMIDTMGEDYIRTARAKGLPERQVVTHHAMRAGVSPIVTLLGIDLALLIGNAVVTETVFNLPGLGNYILVSTDSGDLPAVLAVVVLASFAVAFLSLVADIIYAYLDPEDPIPMTPPLLEVRDLHVHFPTEDGVVKAVDGVSFTLDKGDTLGVVGESGSGKSVTFMTVMGLINRKSARVSGEVLFDGLDLLAIPDKQLRRLRGERIGMVFQDPMTSLHPMHRVGDQIAETVRAHRDVAKDVAGKMAVDALRRGRHPGAASSGPRSTRTSTRAACASAR